MDHCIFTLTPFASRFKRTVHERLPHPISRVRGTRQNRVKTLARTAMSRDFMSSGPTEIYERSY
jgi:hypothetical protein